MRAKIHFISMPWSNPDKPSIQLGCLTSYVERHFGGRVDVAAHSGHWQIPINARQARYMEFFHEHLGVGEELYYMLCKNAGALSKSQNSPREPEMLERLNAENPTRRPVTADLLKTLHRATHNFLREDVLPSVAPAGVNVFGFTLHHEQVFASILAAHFLRQRVPDAIFLFGGGSATFTETLDAIGEADLPGFLVVGEGERPIHQILDSILASPSSDSNRVVDEIEASVPGLYRLGRPDERVRGPGLRPPKLSRYDMNQLPTPDYREYFDKVRVASPDDDCYLEVLKGVEMLVEGSRGCFARCDFCGLNSVWNEFQKMTPRRVFDRVSELMRAYRVPRIRFVDNVCDTWAEEYADLMIANDMKVETFMELRAHHTQEFFTKLSLAGVNEVQVGVEALSTPLLQAMRKRTKVVQNVRAQKYLVELGIRSMSNLMTDHPLSTVEDVEETRRVVSSIPNFGFFELCRYSIAPDSPLFYELAPEEQARVAKKGEWVDPDRAPFGQKYPYEVPADRMLAPETREAWEDFRRWFRELRTNANMCPGSLTLQRLGPNDVLVSDTRGFENREYRLTGDHADVLEACHRGLSEQALIGELEIEARRLSDVLGDLLGDGLLVELDGAYLSTPLRSRDELVARLRLGRRRDGVQRVSLLDLAAA